MSIWFYTGLSVQLTFVPPTKMPPRAPLGPSLVFTAGMFLEGIALVLQKSAAVSKEICHQVSHHCSRGAVGESIVYLFLLCQG